MNRFFLITAFALPLLLAACATDRPAADRGPTPAEIAAGGQVQGEVHWGGRIVAVTNQRDRTLVEVLALPLNAEGRPQTDARPEGRFIVERAGFLEPREYAADRLLEVRGALSGFIHGKVGEAPYRFPMVRGEQLVLWPDASAYYPQTGTPRINFGVGVGSGGGGVGVGIGF